MKATRNGFSLVELIIVIAIIGIGASIATLSFNQWVRKSNIEKETRELLSDLNEARLQSVYTKKQHGIAFQTANSYVLKEYSSLNESSAGGLIKETKTTKYTMTKKDGTAISANTLILFDTRGALSNTMGYTFRFNPIDVAAFDCVVISEARTDLGKMGTGNVCSKK